MGQPLSRQITVQEGRPLHASTEESSSQLHEFMCDSTACPVCHVCLEGVEAAEIGELALGGCSCPSSAGFAHFSCLAAAASTAARGHEESWLTCPACNDEYNATTLIGLARARAMTSSTSETKQFLGGALHGVGQFAEARQFLAEAAAGFSARLGGGHAQALAAKTDLAALLAVMGEREEARGLLVEVAAEQTAQLGFLHIDTLSTKKDLAGLLKMMGWGKENTPRGSATSTAKMDLTARLSDAGAWAEARQLNEEVVAGFEAELDGNHADTLNAKMNLAGLLVQMGECVEARWLYEAVVAGRAARFGSWHVSTLKARANLVAMLAQVGEQSERNRLVEELNVAVENQELDDAAMEIADGCHLDWLNA